MPAQARRRVLIVRDEHTSNDALEQRFRVFGVQVHSAQGVASGCAMLRTHDFAAVVANLDTPDERALAILRAAGRGRPPARVIALIDAKGPGGPVFAAVRNVAFRCLSADAPDDEIEQSVREAITDYEEAIARRAASPSRSVSRAPSGGSRDPAHRPRPADPPDLLNASSLEALTIVAAREAFRVIAQLQPAGTLDSWFVLWPADGEERLTHATRSNGEPQADPPLQLARDAREQSRALALPESSDGGATAAVPVRGDMAVLGVLLTRLPRGAQVSGAHTAALYVVADRIAATQRHLEREQERQRAAGAVCEALLRALELRSPALVAHARRVALLATELAREAELQASPSEILDLERAALLHDIGTLATSDAPSTGGGDASGQLDGGRQAADGYHIIRGVPSLEGTADLVHAFDERWDGSGRPRALAGRNIPFAARILAVAEAWDSMTAELPSGDPVAREEAVTHIRAGSGMRFDPWVVRAFERISGRWASREASDPIVDQPEREDAA